MNGKNWNDPIFDKIKKYLGKYNTFFIDEADR